MRAMILAAGLGTRLRPLTNDRPKALVEINGRTLLEITIRRLASFGFNELIINVHHFAGQVASYLRSKNNFGLRIELSREDDLLLDTGGGLKKAAWFFLPSMARGDVRTAPRPFPSGSDAHLQIPAVPSSEPFLLHNVDVISNLDLHDLLQFHKEHQALATLAVQSRESSRQLLFNEQLQLSGRRIHKQDTLVHKGASGVADARPCHSERSEESAFSSDPPLATPRSPLPQSTITSRLLPLAFSGIHVISPRLLSLLNETGSFSIIDSYLRLSSQGEKILAYRHDNSYWRDLGKPADLAQAALDLQP